MCLVGECGDNSEDGDGEPDYFPCEVCDDPVCLSCVEGTSVLLLSCDACGRMLCRDCGLKPGAGYTLCEGCDSRWCNGCAPSSLTCAGSERKTPANKDGCFATLCDGCLKKDGALASYTFCDGCCSVWCKVCVPDNIVCCTGEECTGADEDGGDPGLEGCYSTFCEECAWDEDKPHCLDCLVCDSTWCTACSPAKDGERITCPKCPAKRAPGSAVCE